MEYFYNEGKVPKKANKRYYRFHNRHDFRLLSKIYSYMKKILFARKPIKYKICAHLSAVKNLFEYAVCTTRTYFGQSNFQY